MSMNSRVKHIRDADASVEIRGPAATALTASAVTTGVPLNRLDAAYWDNNEVPWSTLAVQIVVTAVDTTDGDETYAINLVADSVATLDSTPTVLATLNAVEDLGAGAYILAADADTVAKVAADDFIGLQVVIDDGAANTASIDFYAWLVHLPQA